MKNTAVLRPKAAVAMGALMVHLKPKLAQDAKIELSPLFAGVTAKNFGTKTVDILAGLKALTAGKLAQDADLDDVIQLLDALQSVDVGEAVDADTTPGSKPSVTTPGSPGAAEGYTSPTTSESSYGAADDDDDQLRSLLKAKGMTDEDIEKICGMAAVAADEDDDDKKKDKDMVTKPAMDAAIADAVKIATEAANKTQREIRDAERAVAPHVGELAMAHDSAEAVYRTAFKIRGVNVEGIHPSAFPAILKMQPLPGASPRKATVAMDAAGTESFNKMFPGASRIGRA